MVSVLVFGSLCTVVISGLVLFFVGDVSVHLGAAMAVLAIVVLVASSLLDRFESDDDKSAKAVKTRAVSKPKAQPKPAPKPRPKPPPPPQYYEVYHGTPSITNVLGAIENGFVPGPGGAYGTAVYTAFDLETAKSYARGGYVFKLYISKDTPFTDYDNVPGVDSSQKRAWCLENDIGLVLHRQVKYFICYGRAGVPVKIPGLKNVEVLDEYGNQITLN